MKLIIAFVLLTFTALCANAEDSVFKDRTIEYFKTSNYYEDLTVQRYLTKTEPYIFPIITATTGVVVATAGGVAAGSSVPVIAVGATLNGFVGYFYGYGIEAAIDRHIIVPKMVEQKKEMYIAEVKREAERISRNAKEMGVDAMKELEAYNEYLVNNYKKNLF